MQKIFPSARTADEGDDMYPTDNCAVTPLMGAAFIGDTDAVKAMLADGADIKAKDNAGWTALTYAVWKGHSEIIRLLEEAGTTNPACLTLRRGTDMSATRDYESTALMKAAWCGDTDAVMDLLDKGVDVNSKAAGGITALMFAAWRGISSPCKSCWRKALRWTLRPMPVQHP